MVRYLHRNGCIVTVVLRLHLGIHLVYGCRCRLDLADEHIHLTDVVPVRIFLCRTVSVCILDVVVASKDRVAVLVEDTAAIVCYDLLHRFRIHTGYTGNCRIDLTVCLYDVDMYGIFQEGVAVISCDLGQAVSITFQPVDDDLAFRIRCECGSGILVHILACYVVYLVVLTERCLYIVGVRLVVKLELYLGHISLVVREELCQVQAVSVDIVPVFQHVIITIGCSGPGKGYIVRVSFVTED